MNQPPLSIAIVHASANVRTGGIVKAGLSYVEGLIAAGHNVCVWTASPIFAEAAQALGATVYQDRNIRSFLSVLLHPGLLWHMIQVFLQCDGVIHNNGRLWPLAWLSGRGKHFAVFHNYSVGSRGTYAHWLSISNAQHRYLEEEARQRRWVRSVHRIRNGLSPACFEPLPTNRCKNPVPVIGFLAEIRPKKGLDCLIAAASILKAQGSAFKLVIGGDGSDADKHKAEAERLGVSDHIEWRGWISEPRSFFDEIDIFCLPSRSEPFGLVMIEAMARRVPVVASRTDGPLDLIEQSGGGLLVEIDDAEGLANALQELLEDPQLRQSLSLKGWSYIQENFKPLQIGHMIETAVLNVKR